MMKKRAYLMVPAAFALLVLGAGLTTGTTSCSSGDDQENVGAAEQKLCQTGLTCTPGQGCWSGPEMRNLSCDCTAAEPPVCTFVPNPDVCLGGNPCTVQQDTPCCSATGDLLACQQNGLYNVYEVGSLECVCAAAVEVCNFVDDNCNGLPDEGFDTDLDTYTTCDGDCDDTNAAINPGAVEVCDLIDNNCVGGVDEGFDTDLDTFRTCASCAVAYPVCDCNDAEPAINPNATETCNGGIDDNCNGTADSPIPGGELFCPDDSCWGGGPCAQIDEPCIDQETAQFLRCCGDPLAYEVSTPGTPCSNSGTGGAGGAGGSGAGGAGAGGSGAGGAGGAGGSTTSSTTTSSTTTSSTTTSSSSTTTSSTTTSSSTSSTTGTGGTGGAGGNGVIGSCSGTPVPVGYVRVCYVADSGYALAKYGPCELQFAANTPGPGGFNCWDGQPCSTYGDPANLCVDTNPSDSVLECDLPLPSGTQAFEGDIMCTNNGVNVWWWGDESTDLAGGNGATNGTLTLSTSAGTLVYTMKEGWAGAPYWNYYVGTISVP